MRESTYEIATAIPPAAHLDAIEPMLRRGRAAAPNRRRARNAIGAVEYLSNSAFILSFVDDSKDWTYRCRNSRIDTMTATLLHRDRTTWTRLGGLHTAEEIAQQPALWRALAADLATRRAALETFLDALLADPDQRVILTGAGSSAYIGEIVADTLNAAWPAQIRAVASTSLLTHPELYLERGRPTLLVSFARSGSSPESLAAVELVRREVAATGASVRFLNITCNADGELARGSAGRADTLNVLLPPASCDRGFAMTSSFTAMLLAALTALGREPFDAKLARIEALADAAEKAINAWAPAIATLAAEPFERIVYLGSGPLEALAKEAALKVLELTSGRALAIAQTPLGFRHGPKSALDGRSLVVMFRGQGALARAYEQDLLGELRRDGIAAKILSVGTDGADFSLDAPALPDAWLAPLWLTMAQQYSLQRSAALGLTPDNPFPDGTVNRVVQGVTIY